MKINSCKDRFTRKRIKRAPDENTFVFRVHVHMHLKRKPNYRIFQCLNATSTTFIFIQRIPRKGRLKVFTVTQVERK